MIIARLHNPLKTITLSQLFVDQKEFGEGSYPLAGGRLAIEFDPDLTDIYKNIPSRSYSVPLKTSFISLVDDLAHQAGEWEALELYRYLRKRFPNRF